MDEEIGARPSFEVRELSKDQHRRRSRMDPIIISSSWSTQRRPQLLPYEAYFISVDVIDRPLARWTPTPFRRPMSSQK